jgi:hypothetical protein
MSGPPISNFPQEIREVIKDIIIHNNEKKIRQLQKLTKFILSSPESPQNKGEAIRFLYPILQGFTHIRSFYSSTTATHQIHLGVSLDSLHRTNEQRPLLQPETSPKTSDTTSASTSENFESTSNFYATTSSPNNTSI